MPPTYQKPLLSHALPALVLNTAIALGITAFGERSFATNLVYSQCIGLSIGLLIYLGATRLIQDWERQWRRLVLVVPVGVTVGYMLGTLLADWLLGGNSFGYWTTQPRKALGFLIMSLGAGATATYYFLIRSALRNQREKAEAALRQAAESRLKLLETQLEPHMLFNTLANLRALIGVDPQRAQRMLDHLIAYLRATLSASRASTHTLEQEFDRLRDYLELMSIRMGPRLQFSLDLPPDLRTLGVPPLLLQPLVENSIAHGLEPKVEGGRIDVTARSDGHTVTLDIADTGLGFAVPQGQPPVGGGSSSGFGLAQVQERLHTVYGAAGTIKFIADSEGGTRARITFPLQP